MPRANIPDKDAGDFAPRHDTRDIGEDKSLAIYLANHTAPFYLRAMTAPALFDLTAQAEAHARARASGMFLQELACDEILERLKAVNRQFKSVAIVTNFPQAWCVAFPKAKLIRGADLLDLQPGQHDLVIHAMALHHCNDPIGQVVQCGRALEPDGLFMGVCFGGQTLMELRSALSTAEAELRGGLSPRVTPMAEIRELGSLLQRAGLALPVADSLKIPTAYSDIYHLMQDLRDMGETNIMTARQKTFTAKSLFVQAQEIFAAQFPANEGRIACTFDLVFLSGWAPHASQPKALKPGSVTKSLQQALEEAKSSLGN